MVRARPRETSAPARVSPTIEKIKPNASSIRMDDRTNPLLAPMKQSSRAIMVRTRFFRQSNNPANPASTVDGGKKIRR